jgi:spore coat protein A, manganese oxidase
VLGLLDAVAAAKPKPFARPLRIPKVLTGADLRIDIKRAKVAVLPGKKTAMWTYGGSFPGPTIRRPAGQPTRVTFRNRLPRKAGELSVHLHGGHNTSADDGQPGGLTANQPRAFYCDISGDLSPRAAGNDLLIPSGGERTYEYALTEDGAPERAAFQWYHDHRLERTAPNVWRGLAGMWIIDDELDASLPLPRGERDLALMLTDRAFDRRNQLTDPFSDLAHAPNDGITGRRALVNGTYLPHHRVSATRHRLRLLNASNFRMYDLRLSNRAPFRQIATESGLMPAPVERRTVRIGPGERVELIVDFSPFAGKRIELESVGSRKGGLVESVYRGPLMQFRVGEREPDDTEVPSSLRPLPTWVADAPSQPDRTWTVSVSDGLIPTWLINGKTFDPARVDATPKLGTTETWELRNETAVAHTMHLHHTDWYMLSRNGAPPGPTEDCLKETFLLAPRDRIVIAGHFSDYTGKYVIHCHMLDHEDHGLMTQFEVVPS